MRNILSNTVNLLVAVKNLATGKQLQSARSFFDSRYSLTKFLSLKRPEVNIRCILCGFPRAGTHWILNVINNSTNDKTAEIQKRQVTPADKDVCLIKIHARSKLVARGKALLILPRHRFAGKYIYIYRDPRDAILSLYEMYKKEKNVDISQKEFIGVYDPIRQYRWEITAWVLKKHKNVMVIRYEDLKQNPVEMFGKIFKYLDIDSPINSEILNVRVGMADQRDRPRATAFGWKQASPEYKYLIDTVNAKLSKEIKALGYDINC